LHTLGEGIDSYLCDQCQILKIDTKRDKQPIPGPVNGKNDKATCKENTKSGKTIKPHADIKYKIRILISFMVLMQPKVK
jgi:hypothetical protein